MQIVLTETQVGYIKAMALAGLDLEGYFLRELPIELKRVAIELWRREKGTSLDEVIVAQATDNIGAPPSQLNAKPVPAFRVHGTKRGMNALAAMIGCVV